MTSSLSSVIMDRIRKLAADVVRSSQEKEITTLHLLCVLKGGAKFFHDLTTAITDRIRDGDLDLRLTFDYVKVKASSSHSDIRLLKMT